MVEFKGMRIRKTRLNLSILILGLVIICLLFGIFAKKQSLFASAATNDIEAQQEEAVEHYITFYDGNTSITARSDARTVGEALARANIKLGEYDTVEPDLEERLRPAGTGYSRMGCSRRHHLQNSQTDDREARTGTVPDRLLHTVEP